MKAHLSVKEIYNILTQRKIRRAQPQNPERIKNLIKKNLKLKRSLILTIEWLGVKTVDQGKADEADRLAIAFIKKNIIEKLSKKSVKKVIVKILLADVNASYLDGYSKKRINLYRKTLKKIVNSFGKSFKLLRVSRELYPKTFKLDENDNTALKKLYINKTAAGVFKKTASKAETIYKSRYFKVIKDNAKKHSLLVKNKSLTAEEAAKRYIFFRILTSMLYEKIHPNEIFLSYSYPEINNLIISQPIIYIFSIHKGYSECPWFIGNKTLKKKLKLWR